jgi:hypothetical protein
MDTTAIQKDCSILSDYECGNDALSPRILLVSGLLHEPPLFYYTNLVSDGKNSDKESLSSSEQLPAVPAAREPVKPPSTMQLAQTSINSEIKNNKIEFSLDGPLNSAIVEDAEVSITDLQHELMHWHYRLGHISFAKLKRLAMEKEIQYRLRNARPF